jgi:hypothetical protein
MVVPVPVILKEENVKTLKRERREERLQLLHVPTLARRSRRTVDASLSVLM